MERFGLCFIFLLYITLGLFKKNGFGLVRLVSLEMAVTVAHLTLFCLVAPFVE